jgi:hypothetical protein
MPRHRVPRGRLHGILRRLAFDLAVLAGCAAGGCLFAGAIYLACSLPDGSADQVIPVHGEPVSGVP